MHVAAVWLDKVEQHYGDRLKVNWKYFALEQINEEPGEGVNVWDEPPGYKPRGLLGFKAAEASRRQGDQAFRRFHLALLAERHEKGRRPITDELIEDAARASRIDLDRLRQDMGASDILQPLARDHAEGVERHGVFGTPTLVFDGGQAVFLKMKPPPPEGEMVEVFDNLHRFVVQQEYIAEVKRPQPRT